jgi:hypothetical protein
MISELAGVEEKLALEAWRDVQNRPESDPDSDLTALVPPLARLLGWLAEGKSSEQRGMPTMERVVIVSVYPEPPGGGPHATP